MKRWVAAAAFALTACGVGDGGRGGFPGFGSDAADGSGMDSSDPAGSSGISASGPDGGESSGDTASDSHGDSDPDSHGGSTSTTSGGSGSSSDGGDLDTEGEAGSTSSSTGFDGETATVSGVVYNGFVGTETVSGIDVAVLGHPALTTTTDGAGAFSLDVPADADVTLVAESAGYYGAIRSLPVPSDGLSGFDLRVFVAADLDLLAPLVLPFWNSGAAILVVEADRAAVTVDGSTPDGDLVAPNTHFAWDADGALVESNVTAWPTKYGVTFFNLGALDAGDVDLMPTHATLACGIRTAETPALQTGFITHVDVDCS